MYVEKLGQVHGLTMSKVQFSKMAELLCKLALNYVTQLWLM